MRKVQRLVPYRRSGHKIHSVAISIIKHIPSHALHSFLIYDDCLPPPSTVSSVDGSPLPLYRGGGGHEKSSSSRETDRVAGKHASKPS